MYEPGAIRCIRVTFTPMHLTKNTLMET